MKTIAITLVLFSIANPALAGGNIERACIKSDRNASRGTCSCIQRVADIQLTRSDQRLAVKFFKDPHLAQKTRQSDSASKAKFWKRY